MVSNAQTLTAMDASGSSTAHSFCEATHHVFCSAVIAVPAAVVVKTLKDIESIKRYGVDGGVIGCCVRENTVPPTEIGAVRRCTLRLPPYADKLVREKLTQCMEHHRGRGGGIDDDDDDSNNNFEKAAEELTTMEMCIEYVPCDGEEEHRAPFEPSVAAALRSTCTHVRISTVTRTPHRCYVEMNAECVLRVHQGRRVGAEEKLQDKANVQAVTAFWGIYLDAQLSALERQVVKTAFPELSTPAEADFRAAFATHESVLCGWAVERADTVPRHVAVDELESVLVWWARALEAYKHQTLLTEVAEAAVDRVGPSACALTHPQLHRAAKAEEPTTPTRRASDTVTKIGSGGEGSPDTNNLSDATQTSQSGMDVLMPGFLPPHTLTNAPVSPSAFLRSGSHVAGSTPSELSRQSVQLPRDRRHTAVPKKSLVSTSAAPEAVLPGKAAATGPTASSPAVANMATTSTSNLLQTSVLSHSGRRKQAAVAPSSHLLQQAQRRTSNMTNLSNSVSRHSALVAVVPRGTVNEPTGFFFSQFFATPTYNTPTATMAVVTPAQKLLSTNATTGATVTAVGTTPASSTATPAACAAAPCAPLVSAAATTIEPFQPELVRHLFSLTGALHEDVARRVFLSLCSQGGTSTPRLTADGLKSVVRYLDLCGLREGGVLTGGDAVASDEAYRAEVQRCYHEQNTHTTSSTAKTTRDASRADRESPTKLNSTLRRLTARKEASLRESDEVALDKFVQSLLSRFAFQKKCELSYEEFHLALLHLWNN